MTVGEIPFSLEKRDFEKYWFKIRGRRMLDFQRGRPGLTKAVNLPLAHYGNANFQGVFHE